ncbi:unnamed protein product [Lepeophtheirus salmonis]|uniref:(salmon louse) hypothetical protein n=1 Tax=Lepeophtheirus salmonis TaxID=72036 RepID=A0A7R8HDU8_LEPSM|nr:unnamed protein product [Lepeophtheirus salmonis]CAF3036737.1 unnamed protein product [Lepeophtheirus salmonis]
MTWRTRGKREEVEPPPLQEFDPSSTQNTKRELSQPPALSKTSSASSVSYSSAASDNHQHLHPTSDPPYNKPKEAGKKIALCPTMNGSPSNSLRESEDSSL